MLRYRVQSRAPKYPYASWAPKHAVVSLSVARADQFAKYEIEGDAELVETIKGVLLQSCGVRGQLLQETTTARDLDTAMRDTPMRPYEPELIEGSALFGAT